MYIAGEGFNIPTGAKHPKAAAKFLKWIFSRENQVSWSLKAGMIPAQMEIARDPRLYEGRRRPVMDAFWKGDITAILGTPVDTAFLNVGNKALQEVYLLRKTPKQALDEAQSEMETKVEEYILKYGEWW